MTKHLTWIIAIIISVSILASNNSCKKDPDPASERPAPGKDTIIYTDVTPDSVLSGNSSYSLDLNHDGLFDFTLTTIFHTARCSSRTACGTGIFSTANIAIPIGTGNGIVFAGADYLAGSLDSLTRIDSSNPWSYITNRPFAMYSLNDCRCGDLYNSGLWFIYGNHDRYMGLKLIKGAATYYGWVKLYADITLKRVIVKEFGYNSIAGHAILAGQRR